jgi:methanogenic corrinoid protein MtbC1
MFRWCAYCQRLIGESEPLSTYSITHGVCDACQESFLTDGPEREALVARDLLAALGRLGEAGDLEGCEPFVRSALEAGLRGSEILIGLLHPALGEIGRRWERGEVSVAEEHRFTAFASRVLELVPFPSLPSATRPPVLLAVVEGNEHDLGVRMLQRVAIEQGHPCVAVHPGLPNDDVVDLAAEARPAMLGLSLSIPTMIPRAIRLYRRLEEAEACEALLALGGSAFRQPRSSVPEGVRVLRSIDEFLGALASL